MNSQPGNRFRRLAFPAPSSSTSSPSPRLHDAPDPIVPAPRRVADLVRMVPEDRLRPCLERLFPGEAGDLIAAFRRLHDLQPASDVGMALRLDGIDGEVFVGGTVLRSGEDVALDLCPWDVYLGLEVPEPLFVEFDAAEILAHVLGEMTFFGPTEDAAAETWRTVLRQRNEPPSPPSG